MRITSYTGLLACLAGLSAFAAACSDKANDCTVLLHCSEEAGAGGSSAETGSGGASGGRATGGNASGATTSGGVPLGSGGREAGAAGSAGDNSAEGGNDNAGGEDGGGEEGGSAGNGGEGGTPGIQCDPLASPSTTSCVVDEAYAIFVAPSGMDTASGTRHAPVQTLAKGIELAAMDGKAVIACNGVYDSALEIDDGVRLFGGFDCPGTEKAWTYVPGSVASVVPTDRGPALNVHGSDSLVQIEDFEFRALDAVDAGESSVAATVINSDSVILRRVHLIAGSGKSAADAKNPGFTFPPVTDLQGNSATDVGGAAKVCKCPDGSSSTGGPAGSPPQQNGGKGSPDSGVPGGEGGDSTLVCNSGGGGGAGADGKAAGDAAGASIPGTLMTMGWMPAAGTAGRNGTPGQGGGGGAGKPGGGGGGGGCGGCGGQGGPGGKGGGSSIALVLYESNLVIDAGELTTSTAGNGGSGAPGQQGQTTFGGGGDGAGEGDAGCDGGNGGRGGHGGSGGGGAGGLSVGVLYKGAAPTISGVTVVSTGSSGVGGIGGTPGANDGIKGVSQPTFEVQ